MTLEEQGRAEGDAFLQKNELLLDINPTCPVYLCLLCLCMPASVSFSRNLAALSAAPCGNFYF